MKEDIRKILEKAVWAPSGDNSQPWKFVIQNNTISVFNVPENDNKYYNYKQNASYIAHGGLIENINIACSFYGYKINIQLFPKKEDKNLVSIINLEKSDKTNKDSLYDFIESRCSNRKAYKEGEVSIGDKNSIEKAQDEIGLGEYGKVLCINGKDSVKKIAEAVTVNELTVLETKGLHDAFFSEIVWTEKEEREKRMGLYLKSLELNPPQRVGFKLYKSWGVADFLNKLGMARFVARDNAKLYSKSSAMCAVVLSSIGPENMIRAGRISQRFWLRATQLGLSVQPITGTLFLMHRIRENETLDISNHHIDLIKQSFNKIKEIFNSDNLVMLFRIGYNGKPSARSSRRPPNIVFENP